MGSDIDSSPALGAMPAPCEGRTNFRYKKNRATPVTATYAYGMPNTVPPSKNLLMSLWV